MNAARPLVALLALAAPALVACSSPGVGDDLPDLTTIDPVWEAEGVVPFVPSAEAQPALWTTEDLLVSVGGPVRENRIDVGALDRGSGVAAWTAAVEGSLCSISSDVTDDGLGVLLYRPDPNAECVGVAAVDTTTGEVVWTTEIDVPRVLGRDRQAIVPGVGIGETSVNATSGCGRVARLDPVDGAPIETLGRLVGGFGCSGPGGVGGSLVVYADGRGRDAETVLLDTDRDGPDAEVWRRPADGVVNEVPSTEPLLLDRTDADGRVLRAVDADGSARDIGLRMSPAGVGGFLPTAEAGDVVAGRYYLDEEEVLAFDTTTGDLLWHRPQVRYGPQRRLVGARDGELVWVQGFSAPDAPGDDRVWVTTSDPRDPGAGRTLGSIEVGFGGGDLWTVEGDLLLNHGSSGVTAYALDAAEGGAVDGVEEVPAAYVDDLDEDLDWSPDDVRSADAIGACRDVSPATLEEIGLRTDLPAPVDCRWFEPTSGGGRTTLTVTVAAAEPSAEETAVEAASRQLSETAPPTGVTKEVRLGDEAALTTTPTVATVGYSTEAVTSRLLRVRRGNVVVTVALSVTGPVTGTARQLPGERLEALTATVAGEVLAGVGLDLDAPGGQDDGPVTTTPTGGCADSPALARLVPGGVARRVSSSDDGRVRFCQRRPPNDPYPDAWAGVSAEAVGPGLGTSAVEAAASRLEALAGQEVTGLGDQAVLVVGTDSSTDTRALVVRRDNLLVTVRSVRDGGTSVRTGVLRRVAARLLADARG